MRDLMAATLKILSHILSCKSGLVELIASVASDEQVFGTMDGRAFRKTFSSF